MTQVLTVSLLFIGALFAPDKVPLDVLSVAVHQGDILLEAPPESINWTKLEEFGPMDNTTTVYWLRLTYHRQGYGTDDPMRQGVLLLSLFFDKVESFKSPEATQAISITGKMVDYQDRSIAKGFYKNAIPLHFDDGNTRYIKLTCYRSDALINRS